MATYTEQSANNVDGSSKRIARVVDIAFDGSEPYSSGVSIDKAKLGCPNVLESLEIIEAESDNARIYKFDAANEKLRVYAESADSYAEVGATPAETVRVKVVGW